MNPQPMPQGTAIRVDLKDLKTIGCDCGCKYFEPLLVYKILPALYSTTGAEQLIVSQGCKCMACTKAWELDTLLQDYKEREKKILLSAK